MFGEGAAVLPTEGLLMNYSVATGVDSAGVPVSRISTAPIVTRSTGTNVYYLRADGTASKVAAVGPETDPSKCMSLATHNSSTFSPDDLIWVSDQGGDFRGKLDIPSSGDSTNEILYKSIPGETPYLNGAIVKTNDSFTAVSSPLLSTAFTAGSIAAHIDASTTRNYRIFLPSASLTPSTSPIKILLAASLSDGTINGMGIGPAVDAQTVSDMTRVTFDEGSNSTTILGGERKYTDDIDIEILTDTDYIITLYMIERHIDMFAGPTGSSVFWNSTAVDGSQVTTTAYTSNVGEYTIGVVEISASLTINNTFEAVKVGDPLSIWKDGERLVRRSTIGLVENNPGSECYLDNKVYVHPYGSTNPITDGSVYELGDETLGDIIDYNGKDYVTVDGVNQKQNVGTNDLFCGVKFSGIENKWLNAVGHDTTRHLISYAPGSVRCIADNCEVYNSDDAALVSYGAVDNVATDCISQNITAYQTVNFTGALFGTHGGVDSTDNWITQDSDFGDTFGTSYAQCWLFMFDAGTTGVTVRRNRFHGVGNEAFELADANGLNFYNNIVDVSGLTSTYPIFNMSGFTGSRIFNNTFVGDNLNYIFSILAASTGNFIKNNIFAVSGKLINMSVDSVTDTDIDYNCYPVVTTDLFTYASADADLAVWKTASSLDANSISDDPLLTTDNRLGVGSHCINAGTNPFTDGDGDQYDADGYKVWDDTYDLPDGHWIDGVDIGAYAYGGANKVYLALIDKGSDIYALPSAPQLIAALGLSSIWYDADGVGIDWALADLLALNGPITFGSTAKGVFAIYDAAQVDPTLTKILTYMGN
jgi:hypothetical protein